MHTRHRDDDQRGRNVNVTLIFSLERYQEVMDAYLRGLDLLSKSDASKVRSVSSVASFFISRVDTEIDQRLITGAHSSAEALLGTAAINQAKIAYEMFQRHSRVRIGTDSKNLAQKFKDRFGRLRQLRILSIQTRFM